MESAPAPRRAALYLDFDNVFSTLAALDEAAAWHFASDPGRWLALLAAGTDRPRRILVRRCYLNPAGWAEPAPGGALAAWLGQPRLYYSRFRADFVRAGFEVVDCPRLARLKNGADIQMALDIAEALHHPTRFDEFLILSGDSDFTPLLHRLRAHDRLTLLAAEGASAQALRAAADAVMPLLELAEAAQPEPGTAPGSAEAGPAEPAAQRAAILGLLRQEVAAAPGPLHLPALGKRIHQALGGWVRTSRYGGAGSLAKLLEGVDDLALEAGPGGGWLFDSRRHERPSLRQPGLPPEDPLAALLAELGPALREAPALPALDAEALELALHGLAALLPLPGPPDQAQLDALAAEAAAAGFELSVPGLAALVAWLQRARLDWRQPPGPEAAARLGRTVYAELARASVAAGLRLPEARLALLRHWVGLAAPRREPAAEAREAAPQPLG